MWTFIAKCVIHCRYKSSNKYILFGTFLDFVGAVYNCSSSKRKCNLSKNKRKKEKIKVKGNTYVGVHRFSRTFFEEKVTKKENQQNQVYKYTKKKKKYISSNIFIGYSDRKTILYTS